MGCLKLTYSKTTSPLKVAYSVARSGENNVQKFPSVDPLAHEFPWQSPYCAFDNNPIINVDPDGRAAKPASDAVDNITSTANASRDGFNKPMQMGESTSYVDKNGKLLDVVNDGKTDIVQFNDLDYSTWKGTSSDLAAKTNGTVVGQTMYWYDFMNTADNTINQFTTPARGAQVLNGFDGNLILSQGKTHFQNRVKKYGFGTDAALADLAMMSRNGALYDVKTSLKKDRYTSVVITTAEGVRITSLRMLGNIMFGANLQTARSAGGVGKDDFWKNSMFITGKYNMHQNNVQVDQYYEPFYGEHLLSGSGIWYGYYGTIFKGTYGK